MGSSKSKMTGFGNSATYVPPSAEELQAERDRKQPRVWLFEPGSQGLAGSWVARRDAQSYPAQTTSPAGSLVLASYNVWFEDHNFDARGAAISDLLRAAEADVIALQEVTEPFLVALLQNSWVRDSYAVSDATGDTLGGYGVVLLVRCSAALQLVEFRMHELDSIMGRQLLVARLDVGGEPMLAATVHLESLKCQRVREAQLDTIFPILRRGAGAQHSLLMGDFNFSDGWPETAHIDGEFVDLWRAISPEATGWTMPACEEFEAWRPDRMLLRSSTLAVTAMEIIGRDGLVGCDACETAGRKCTPSDHYGLVAKLQTLSSSHGPP